MSKELKTRREHLKLLPLQKRLQAMENIRKEYHQYNKNYSYDDCHVYFNISVGHSFKIIINHTV